jgi:hypothetical protein
VARDARIFSRFIERGQDLLARLRHRGGMLPEDRFRLAQHAEQALAEMEAIEDPAWSAHVRIARHYHGSTVAAFGHDMALFASRIRSLEAAALAIGGARYIALASMQRAAHALSVGDVASALALAPAALRNTAGLGNPLGFANARLKYSIALLLADRDEEARGLMCECLPVARLSGVLGWACDPLALYAARQGRASEAARLVGFADACYAAIEEIRRPIDERVAALAMDLAASMIGGEAARDSRDAGKRLPVADGFALAQLGAAAAAASM